MIFSSLLCLLWAATNSGVNCNKTDNKVVVSYFSDWTNRFMNADQIPYTQVTHINYAFAILTEAYKPVLLSDDFIIKAVVSKAHKNNVKVMLSVGGWTGSKYFSLMVKSSNDRAQFIKDLGDLCNKYNLDGIDLDWEYPGKLGHPQNEVDPQNDAKNFILLLREMRNAFPNKLITLAVGVGPIKGPGATMSELSQYVDFINIMAYDVYGSWSNTTGPNAPMYNATGKVEYSFDQSLKDWVNSGFPKDKIVMGLPFYGRALTAKSDMTLSPSDMYQLKELPVPRADQDDALWSDGPNLPYVFSGIWRWRNLRSQNVLNTPTTPGPGWYRFWDNESKTPWLFNKQTKMFISYDDPLSLDYKIQFIIDKDLKGAMIWSSEQDNGELMDVVAKLIKDNKPPTITQTISYTSTTQAPSATLTSTSGGFTTTTTQSNTPTSSPDKDKDSKCINGMEKCFGDGKGYKSCIGDVWVSRPVAVGTKCVQEGDHIRIEYA